MAGDATRLQRSGRPAAQRGSTLDVPQ